MLRAVKLREIGSNFNQKLRWVSHQNFAYHRETERYHETDWMTEARWGSSIWIFSLNKTYILEYIYMRINSQKESWVEGKIGFTRTFSASWVREELFKRREWNKLFKVCKWMRIWRKWELSIRKKEEDTGRLQAAPLRSRWLVRLPISPRLSLKRVRFAPARLQSINQISISPNIVSLRSSIWWHFQWAALFSAEHRTGTGTLEHPGASTSECQFSIHRPNLSEMQDIVR